MVESNFEELLPLLINEGAKFIVIGGGKIDPAQACRGPTERFRGRG